MGDERSVERIGDFGFAIVIDDWREWVDGLRVRVPNSERLHRSERVRVQDESLEPLRALQPGIVPVSEAVGDGLGLREERWLPCVKDRGSGLEGEIVRTRDSHAHEIREYIPAKGDRNLRARSGLRNDARTEQGISKE